MKLLLSILFILNLSAQTIDAVLATVDNQPILLSELNKELPVKIITSKQIKGTEAEKVLEQMINKKLLELEAERLNIKVSDTEVISYIDEIKRKNRITDEDLKAEIAKQNLTWEAYLFQIKIEYIKTKIAATLAREGKAVSSAELQAYLDAHPEFSTDSTKLVISQIVINKTGRSYETAKALIYGVYDSLLTKNFNKQVQEFSEAPDAKFGGSLGILVKDDLSEDIKYKLEYLNIGEFSAPLEDANSFRIFKIEGIIETEDELRTQVRNILKKQNTGFNLEDYFKNEIFTHHAVERKF